MHLSGYSTSFYGLCISFVDEYMESVVALFSDADLRQLKAGLGKIHPNPDPSKSVIRNPRLPSAMDNDQTSQESDGVSSAPVDRALQVLYRWCTYVLNWDQLKNASATDLNDFRFHLKTYLLSHIHQLEDNARFAAQLGRDRSKRYPDSPLAKFKTPRTSYTTWLHTVGGYHISAPVSLAFAACYMGSWLRNGSKNRRTDALENGWKTPMQAMLAYETNIHVAAYCRIYNDCSTQRDAEECNLNSVNFPEFWADAPARLAEQTDADYQMALEKHLKGKLREIGQHEREMADLVAARFYKSLQEEGTEAGARIAQAMRIYFRSGELFSDMYLSRDVTNSIK